MGYFRDKEFECPCCHIYKIDKEFRFRLDSARHFANIPFIINSGYRCPVHNKEIHGSSTSSHLKGLAVDISVRNNNERFKILEGLIYAGLKRIGIGFDFIHTDMDTEKPKELIWTYYKKD